MASRYKLGAGLAVPLVCGAMAAVLMQQHVAWGTGDMAGALCAEGQNCSNCKVARGTYYGQPNRCWASKGGSGSGSAKLCIYDSNPSQNCQSITTQRTILECRGSSSWDCGPMNQLTGDCDNPCPCDEVGGPDHTGGTFHTTVTCTS